MTTTDITGLPGNENLRRYIVSLREAPGNSIIDFDCWADEPAHALEQADSAYPGCVVVGCDLG